MLSISGLGGNVTVIKQWYWKKAKMAHGILNTYIRKTNEYYRDVTWWNDHFYTDGVSDRQTIAASKNVLSALYHYASIEMLILKHLRNHDATVNQSVVLDLGSGSGHWIDFYRTLGAKNVTAIDISFASCTYLMEKYADNDSVDIHQGRVAEIIQTFDTAYDLVNAIGFMFHIVDDSEWSDTIMAIGSILKSGGFFIAGGHFGCLDNLNVQIDTGGINKRLRSKRRWIQTLTKAGFSNIKVYRNNAHLWINDTLPENNVLVAVK